jgi:hypothetical protein
MKYSCSTALLILLLSATAVGESPTANPQKPTEITEIPSEAKNYQRLEAELLAKTKEQLATIKVGMTRREFEAAVGPGWELGITATWNSVQKATYRNRKLPDYRLKVDYGWTEPKEVFQRRFTPDDPISAIPEREHAPWQPTAQQLARLEADPIFGPLHRGRALIRIGDLNGATAVYRSAIAEAMKRLTPESKSPRELHWTCMLAGKEAQYIDEDGGHAMALLLCDDVLRGLKYCRDVKPDYEPEQLSRALQQMEALRTRLRDEVTVQ